MLDYCIVYIYTDDNIVTDINYNSIIKYHDNVFKINNKDFTTTYSFLGIDPISNWSRYKLWWSCDNIFLYWYLSNPQYRFKNYILVEWDTYCHNTSIPKFIGTELIEKNNGIISASITSYIDHPNDHWYKKDHNIKLLKKYFKDENIYKYSPMSCSVISDNCVKDIIDYIQEYPEINSIYIENKFPSIAHKLGYSLVSMDNKKSYISYHENICHRQINNMTESDTLECGVFHPVKNYKILCKYFLNNKNHSSLINNDTDIEIISAVYGTGIDVTVECADTLNKLNKICSNNYLGGDPVIGLNKQLFITYRKNDQLYHKIIPENKSINITEL